MILDTVNRLSFSFFYFFLLLLFYISYVISGFSLVRFVKNEDNIEEIVVFSLFKHRNV